MIPRGVSRFAFIEGYYLFCTLWHGGQDCPLYARLCRVSEHFTPGPMWSESRVLTDETGEYSETLEVYLALCEKHGIHPEGAQ